MAGNAREPQHASPPRSAPVGHDGRDGPRAHRDGHSSAHTTTLRPGRFCLLCPKANKNDISALFGSLSSSLTLRGSFGGKSSSKSSRSFKSSKSSRSGGGSLARVAALIGNDALADDAPGEGGRRSRGGLSPRKPTSDGSGGVGSALDTTTTSGDQAPVGPDALTVNTWNQAPHTWHLGHGSAAVVNFGMFEVTSGINRVQPSVYFDGSDEPCLCVFQGYLSNLEELVDRYMPHGGGGGLNKPKRSPGERAAALLYTMFWSDDRNAEDPLMVLSELQGQYAFVMYNGDRKQVFAARDSSGKERLYFELDDENGVTVSNAKELRVRSVDGMGWVVFEELQPGHYMSGRPVKVNQFALTREEMREREEFLEGGGLAGLGLEI